MAITGPIKGHLQADAGQRSDARRVLRLETEGRTADGAESNVTIHNISAAGLLIETGLNLVIDERLELELPEAGRVSAMVVWHSGSLYGCAFEGALSSAALAATQLRAAAASPAGAGPLAGAGMSDTLGPALGAKLNRLRRERGLTLADIAARLGVSKPNRLGVGKGQGAPRSRTDGGHRRRTRGECRGTRGSQPCGRGGQCPRRRLPRPDRRRAARFPGGGADHDRGVSRPFRAPPGDYPPAHYV